MLHWENAKQIETQSTYLKELLHSRKEMLLWSIYTHYLPTGCACCFKKISNPNGDSVFTIRHFRAIWDGVSAR